MDLTLFVVDLFNFSHNFFQKGGGSRCRLCNYGMLYAHIFVENDGVGTYYRILMRLLLVLALSLLCTFTMFLVMDPCDLNIISLH